MTAATSRRYLVTPSGYDDIGAVLDSLGQGFEHGRVSFDELQHPQALDGCEVLFVNCSPEATGVSEPVAAAIRKFVERGGSLYASDWAGALIDRAFPGVLRFDTTGAAERVPCRVVDPGLAAIIGDSIDITFEIDAWWGVVDSKRGSRVYVERSTGPSQRRATPIVIGFAAGNGQVIYTSFHNKSQLSEKERGLLRFLVLRPIVAGAAEATASIIRAERLEPGKMIPDAIQRKASSRPYAHKASRGEGIVWVLTWNDSARMRLIVKDPGGRVVRQVEGSRTPLRCEVEAIHPGDWYCVVECLDASKDNVPYALTLARRTSGTAAARAEGGGRSGKITLRVGDAVRAILEPNPGTAVAIDRNLDPRFESVAGWLLFEPGRGFAIQPYYRVRLNGKEIPVGTVKTQIKAGDHLRVGTVDIYLE